MNRDLDEEILNMTNRLQWALGESLFRAKKLKELLNQNQEFNYQLIVNMRAFISALTEFSDSYRHEIADRIRDQLKDK